MFELSAPGKTFLLGEYYVMDGGEAYVLNTAPRFRLRCEPQKNSSSTLLPTSPAGKFVSEHPEIFSNYSLTFSDPYQGLGGFGASTAEFLLVYQAKCLLTGTELNPQELLKDYLTYAWNGLGFAPSGADLLAQLSGNLCYVNKNSLQITSQTWPFTNVDFHLIHTRNKLATHSHLANLASLDTAALEIIFNRGKVAIALGDETLFCEAVNCYHQSLTKLGLVSEYSLELIQRFRDTTKILAAKGCGAMGSDTLLLITEHQQHDTIKKLCKKFNLVYIASNTSLTDGLSRDLVS